MSKTEVNQSISPMQRRECPRFLTNDITVELETAKKNIITTGKTINISKTGLNAVLDKSLALSERVNIKMRFPEGETHDYKGRIIWGNKKGENNFQYGINFAEWAEEELLTVVKLS